jgi:hypothetical protein
LKIKLIAAVFALRPFGGNRLTGVSISKAVPTLKRNKNNRLQEHKMGIAGVGGVRSDTADTADTADSKFL